MMYAFNFKFENELCCYGQIHERKCPIKIRFNAIHFFKFYYIFCYQKLSLTYKFFIYLFILILNLSLKNKCVVYDKFLKQKFDQIVSYVLKSLVYYSIT